MAASAVKLAANRANAALSTGPNDTSRTRFNGVAHGLTSKQTVIPGESQEAYDAFAAEMQKDLRPSSAIEKVLADRVIAAAWRMQRFTRIETSFLTNRIDTYLENHPDHDPDAALANLFIDPAEAARMRLFLRYQNAVQREYDKAFKELQTAQVARRKQERALAALAMHDESEADETVSDLASGDCNNALGFASQPLSHAGAVANVLPSSLNLAAVLASR